VRLPRPRFESGVSIEEALRRRRSVREFKKGEPMNLEEVSQLLWSLSGITQREGGRTSPSAGALYPLEISLLAGDVLGLPAGLYRFDPHGHDLQLVAEGDRREQLAGCALDQSAIKDAAMVIVVSAVYERTTMKYGKRGTRYVHFEVGHAAQNVYLQAVSLGLGVVAVGAFDDEAVKRSVELREGEEPQYLLSLGRK